jgi:hypothetical protein
MMYFAYGSDLNRDSVIDWSLDQGQFIPPTLDPVPAVLMNHRLAFPFYDRFWRGGTADAIPETGKSVGGAIFNVSETTMKLLDRMAGRSVDRHQRETGLRERAMLPVQPYGSRTLLSAFTYRLRNREHEHVPPSESYLQRLVDTAWKLGLSSHWVMHLRSFSTQPIRQIAPSSVIRAASADLAQLASHTLRPIRFPVPTNHAPAAIWPAA